MKIIIDTTKIKNKVLGFITWNIHRCTFPFRYLIAKPKMNYGDKLAFNEFNGNICLGLKFNWHDGIWYIKISDGLSISAGLEIFYKSKYIKGDLTCK